ncbi:16S rRNA (guanine(527)-N(7))-methyltransferase RsmG [Acuticoccus mangrovi]|uniref:Ribosomal RNA small subunit methyltransferase G n=1 Tax=Acuticoccus mangrovi TaxID=2796142 RepID=A0A934MJ26_9HYPH|nr:16S rRNA (guanine(527)-N(7))-methyltransferase RsmG [Acuticoccus mangrovi]MBJ3777821.1 16S rRNA (guanine(527)-N(7))-methyltransferase RsmG [Acuticoccus mangrovi]
MPGVTGPPPEVLASEERARETIRAEVGSDVFAALERFVEAARAWGRVSNIVSEADRERLWERHVLDSLQLVPLAEAAGPAWIDLGSGGGFPGLVVAIVRGGEVTLVESNRKKAAFLIQASAATGRAVRVEPRRIEELAATPYDVVSARALAPLATLLDLSSRFFGPDTVGLFPKGRDADNEVREAQKRHRFAVASTPSRTDPRAAILSVSELKGA